MRENVPEVTEVKPNELSAIRTRIHLEEKGLADQIRGPVTAPPPDADNTLPHPVTLKTYFPPVKSQGGQGSCTCFAVGSAGGDRARGDDRGRL